jgi:hypothetical protein
MGIALRGRAAIKALQIDNCELQIEEGHETGRAVAQFRVPDLQFAILNLHFAILRKLQ